MKRILKSMDTIDKVKEIISLMNVHNLAEIEVQEDTLKIRVRRTNGGLQPSMLSSGNTPVAVGGEAQYLLTQKDFLEIASPMVGTFYRAATPGAEPYIEIGDTVGPETVVCVIEAMKIINEIKAEVVGKVAEVLVEDGKAVEFGQPLFRLMPSNLER